ncbi:3-phosphoshikimate 1-carboxyvinyltransferase [Deltaproteobacteria bacterium]|nr:3-phosphoshikimate 1-carboxyvinyltransferase [Deltaproteobacteria bacterium]
MRYAIDKSTLGGAITVTSSKSHTMRAVLLASLARGESRIRNPLPSPDTRAMIAACAAFGAKIREEKEMLAIIGTGGVLSVPPQVIDVGNSGQVLRFGAAFAAMPDRYAVLTGDDSVCSNRPMQPLLDALIQLGAFAVSSKGDGYAPIIIKGPVASGNVTMDGKDSQPVSAMLMLAAFLPGVTRITVKNPGERPWIDLTLYWLEKLGIPCAHNDYREYTVRGPAAYAGFDYTVPGDWSSAAFPLAAALVTNSPVILSNLDIADSQGDKAILALFTQMGANVTVDGNARTISVHKHKGLRGITVDANAVIDAVPILATVACFADSPTTITGAGIARHKESDRLSAITMELAKMGARIEEFDEGLRIAPARLHGAECESRRDHRIALSLAVAGLACGGTIVNDVACAAKSFPGFAEAMRGIGAAIRVEH